jgi:exodeoxyribonuclease-3
LKIASWNVNGIRAVQRKGALDWIWDSDLDLVCLQETKAHPEQLDEALTAPPGWGANWAAAEKKGYSGVVTYHRESAAPRSVETGIGTKRYDGEGRVVRGDHGDFLLYNVYFPNGKASPERLAYKMGFYRAFRTQVNKQVAAGRRVVICGDVNTAHREIDLARPKENVGISGFLPEERAWLDRFLGDGWVDSFRAKNGDVKDCYTWWSMRSGARLRNVGWRIDYFIVDSGLAGALAKSWTSPEIMGSDHCPLGIELDL